MFDYLRELCSINAVSGREKPVRDYIIGKTGGHPYITDPMGNLIVSVKGRETPRSKVMICAHMDEVGFIATYVGDDGLISFTTVGGIEPAVTAGRTVVFENGTAGVIGMTPVHLAEKDKRGKIPEMNELTIDIGAKDREEAEKLVMPGDTAVFTNEYVTRGNKILSRAIDDRVGCAIMLDMINKGVKYDTVFVFNTQEEVGCRGSKVSAYTVRPDYALVLEGTTASDINGVEGGDRVCVQGEGAAVSFMDCRTVYNPDLYKKVWALAEEKGIACQTKTKVAGGNDAGSIHQTAGGINTVAINVPCRYIHSASSVCDVRDVLSARALTEAAAEYFANV